MIKLFITLSISCEIITIQILSNFAKKLCYFKKHKNLICLKAKKPKIF